MYYKAKDWSDEAFYFHKKYIIDEEIIYEFF